jgi:hypothetical protein
MLLALLTVLAPDVRGQSVWRYLGRPDMTAGLMLYEIRSTPADVPNGFDRSLIEVGVGVGATIPVIKLDRDMSIAVIPQIAIAGVPGNSVVGDGDRFPLTMSFEAPLFAAFKYGTDAVWYSDTKAGFGLGIGGWYGAFTTLDPVDLVSSYLRPAVMVEASVVVARKLLKLRYCRLLGESLHDVDALPGDPVDRVAVTQQSIQLLFNLGY